MSDPGDEPLRRAYRWALKAYPASYRAQHGEDLAGVIAAAHEGDRRASLREFVSLIWAGVRRRGAAARNDPLGASVALFISCEALFALYLGALGILNAVDAPLLAPGQYPFYQTGSWRVVRHFHVVALVGYVSILLVVAVVLACGAARTWSRIGDDALTRWRSFDFAVAWSQPVVGLLAAVAVAALLDDRVLGSVLRSVILSAVGVALGSMAVVQARRRTPGSAAAIARATVGAVLLVTAGCSAFAIARVRFGGSVFFEVSGGTFDASVFEPAVGVGPVLPDGNLADGFSTSVALPTGTAQPQAVSCAGREVCTVFASQWTTTGFNIAMRYEHGTWLASGIPVSAAVSQDNYLPSALACARPDTCYLVGDDGVAQRSTDGGREWHTVSSPTNGPSSPEARLVCPVASRCLYLDPESGRLLLTTNAGRSWTRRAQWPAVVDGGGLGLQCPTSRDCFELDTGIAGFRSGAVLVRTELRSSIDGGLRWTSRTVSPLTGVQRRSVTGLLALRAFACSNAVDCVSTESLAGGTASITYDGGRVWDLVRLPPEMTQAATIPSVMTCSSGDTCWAVTTHGDLWRSDDGGALWTHASLPSGIAIGSVPGPRPSYNSDYADAMSCPTQTRCVALGTVTGRLTRRGPNVLLSTTNGGRTWMVATPPLAPELLRPRPVPVG